ncbi:FlgN protein [Desulfosporosinus acidiphilus SJ4]|uniref:FlgN protein n=1 Tax=Desulfosporosinus acidiphilus (strain DSM 22704 / JCM 16185 / SJ4) TaxID=646529 RepID=I4DAB6_DESAJ|nr:flagellar export chaperone FlgN [Desulfosporosinus acidiphilus]AFM42740.1 FlgN protein [Desulfosporosinus acidiphilus SJ4]
MSKALQNLEENLKQQVAYFEELKVLEKNKQKALIENDICKIDEFTAREERLLLLTNRLEEDRLLFTQQIAAELGQETKDLTLAVLADWFPALQEVRLELEQEVRELQNIHRLNTQLLKQAMRIVEFTVGLFTYKESHVYSHPQRKDLDANKVLHLLDRRI